MRLTLKGPKVTDSTIDFLIENGLDHLTDLALFGTLVTDLGAGKLTQFKKLKRIDFRHNEFTSLGWKEVGKVKSLTYINLVGDPNQLGSYLGELPKALPSCEIWYNSKKYSAETAVNNTKLGRASAISNSPEAAAAIEAAIRKAAGKPVGSLTKADKEKVKVLFLKDSQISDLTPFSDLNNLEELHLNQNLISDLNPIRNLKNLQRLSLKNNRVVDISPIKGLTKLYAFHVSNDNLTSEGSRVRDLSALKELNLLRNLGLANNHYIKDLKPLSGLPALERIDLSGNTVSDIDLLKHFINLKGITPLAQQ